MKQPATQRIDMKAEGVQSPCRTLLQQQRRLTPLVVFVGALKILKQADWAREIECEGVYKTERLFQSANCCYSWRQAHRREQASRLSRYCC